MELQSKETKKVRSQIHTRKYNLANTSIQYRRCVASKWEKKPRARLLLLQRLFWYVPSIKELYKQILSYGRPREEL